MCAIWLSWPSGTMAPSRSVATCRRKSRADVLVSKRGQRFPIVPGMVTTADIRTGHKTVWDYLTKPLNKAREAMRER